MRKANKSVKKKVVKKIITTKTVAPVTPVVQDDAKYRPRLSKDEYDIILAMRAGWVPGVSEMPTIFNNMSSSPARVLVIDVETAPMRSYTWGCWKQNVQMNQIITDWFMLTWSAKWLFEDEVFSDKLTPKEVVVEDDKRISKSIWKLLDEADIIIAHNANRFDVKRLNTRFLINGLNSPMPYQVIDTLEHVKKRFSISSNRLDYVNKVLGLGRKMDTGGFGLWDSCMKGDPEALQKMEDYNIEDVKILEETYLRIRSWIKPHPNIGLFIDDDITRCPSCGGENITFGTKPYATTACLYDLFRCDDCGSVGRSKKANKTSSITRPVPR